MRASLLAFLLIAPLGLFHCDSSGTDPNAGNPAGSGGAAGATGQGGNGSAQALADCKEACVTIDALKCFKNLSGDCAKVCDTSAKAKSCAAEFSAYSTCAKTAAWQCVDGFAQSSACADSQKKLVDCLAAKGQGSGELGAQGNFFCDKTVCDGSPSEKACCLKLSLATFSTEAKCVSSIDQCGEDSRWECDGPDDCGGRPCCWAQQSAGMGQIVVGLCRDSCNPILGEKEVCYDTCTGGKLCCKAPDEKTGTCQPDQPTCDAVLAEQKNKEP